ncbi:MAG: DUF350 domain-containing protein [Ardenticatenales bacterium]|nr:DUF350 domain-containing protein [Ardenticatenales bacterium]
MIRKLYALAVALVISLPATAAFAQDPSANDLSPWPLLSSLIYGIIGILIYVLGYLVFDRMMQLNLRRELVEDQNQALGIMLAGLFIGLAIVIAAAIN